MRNPIEKENGEKTESLILKEPVAEQLIASSNKDEMAMTVKMISKSADIPLGIAQRLGMKDLTLIGAIMFFFA